MVVVRRDEDVGVFERGVRAAQDARHVISSCFRRFRSPSPNRHRLEIALVSNRLEASASKLRRDVFGGKIQSPRRSSSSFERVARKEAEVALEGIGGDAIERSLPLGR